MPFRILSFISLGWSFLFTWRHHTLRKLSMLPYYLIYKMHFSAILFIHLFKISLKIWSQNNSHFNLAQWALRKTVTEGLSFKNIFGKVQLLNSNIVRVLHKQNNNDIKRYQLLYPYLVNCGRHTMTKMGLFRNRGQSWLIFFSY